MKGWSSFVIAAVVTFGVTVAGTVRANWYVNAVPAATCKNIYGLPQLGTFGDLYTNSEFEPSGDTFYGGLTCYYQDHSLMRSPALSIRQSVWRSSPFTTAMTGTIPGASIATM